MQHLKTKCQFLVVGGVAFAVDISVYMILTEVLTTHYLVARVVAFLIAVGVTCKGNSMFTFSQREKTPFVSLYKKAVCAALISFIPNVAVFWGVIYMLPPSLFASVLAFVLGTSLGIVLNYVLSDKYVFSPSFIAKK